MAFDNRMLAIAHQLADSARVISKQYFRSHISVESKGDLSPVTIADRTIEMTIREILQKELPQHGIVGEEFGSINPNSDYQWVIDPIDGTRAFIAGIPTFATLIALCKDGKPVLGIIDQPILAERWVGGEHTLAALNDKPVRSSQVDDLSQATIATTSTYHFNEDEKPLFETLRKKSKNTLLGGDAYIYAMLASGHVDMVIDSGLKPYDFCALAPVIAGSGGIITDWDGHPLTLTSSGKTLAAATKMLHAQALAILKQSGQ